MPGSKGKNGSDQSKGSRHPEREDPFSYAVGWGKPPKATRFKAGKSGNPKGRPRKPETVQGLIDQLLEKKVVASVNGKRQRITNAEAFILASHSDAMRGGIKEKMAFLNLMEKVGARFPTEKDKATISQQAEKAQQLILRQIRALREEQEAEDAEADKLLTAEDTIINACMICGPQIKALREGDVPVPKEGDPHVPGIPKDWFSQAEPKKR